MYFFACVAISVRSLSKTEPNYRIAFYFTVLCSILGLATFFKGDWILPTKIDLIIFIVMGLCGSVANIVTYSKLQISRGFLGHPYKVFEFSFCNSFWFFNLERNTKILTLLGALLVIASSLIIFTRENKLKKQIINPRA